MNGREMIEFIKTNNLENEELIRDDIVVGYNSLDDISSDMYVGMETINKLIAIGKIQHVKIGNQIFIPCSRTPMIGGLYE